MMNYKFLLFDFMIDRSIIVLHRLNDAGINIYHATLMYVNAHIPPCYLIELSYGRYEPSRSRSELYQCPIHTLTRSGSGSIHDRRNVSSRIPRSLLLFQFTTVIIMVYYITALLCAGILSTPTNIITLLFLQLLKKLILY